MTFFHIDVLPEASDVLEILNIVREQLVKPEH